MMAFTQPRWVFSARNLERLLETQQVLPGVYTSCGSSQKIFFHPRNLNIELTSYASTCGKPKVSHGFPMAFP